MPKLFVAGDVVNYHNKTGLLCSNALAAIIKFADYSICNLEAPISGAGSPIQKCGPNLEQSPLTIDGLQSQGFNLLLLANNHIMDFGREALTETISYAKKLGLDITGAGLDKKSAYSPLIKNISGVTVGIINACEAQFGVIDHFERDDTAGYAWINHPEIDKNIIKLNKQCDFIIVLAHAGLENYSIPLKEWRERYKHLCDLGADVVIGSHPHVPQGYEEHNGSLIFYSLGNFYFDFGYAQNYENPSYALMLELTKGHPPSFTPVHHITHNNQVHIAKKEEETDLQYLCHQLGSTYKQSHDEMCLNAYKTIRRTLATSSMEFPTDGTIKGTFREILATLVGRRKKINKQLTHLHFMRNEAYYYATRHALEIKSKENA